MLLADYTPERVAIKDYKGVPRMEVRGLSLDDVSLLIRSHLADLQRLYDMLNGGDVADAFKLLITDGFILKLLTDFPELAARMIAVAADEPGATANARRLPLPLQIMAIQAIMRLTFEDVGGPKAFVALIGSMIGKLPLTGAEATFTP